MPGKVKVRVVAGRSLPVMDRSNDTTDAYVEVKLGQVTHKTDVCRKSLNPQWNSEWFKFEMDDLELQDEPLQIRLMDYDTYSANDAIGKVYLDLNPLLINLSSKGKDNYGKTISGWIPVYDTMHGIRGEVNILVKVAYFSDLNKYRQSSCGVRFFFSPQIPEGFIAHSVNGFVEELVINDDPEYQWIDKIRTPRASNEARQTLFQKLSGEVQRKVGLKALELGGNAVVGYKQSLDLEGESGIVIRGIGTAMFLTKMYDQLSSPVPMTSTSSDPISNNVPTTKESLYHQHSLPRKQSPRLQRSFRLPPNPLSTPSMLYVDVDGGGANSSDISSSKPKLQKSHSHSHHDPSGLKLSESFSNLVKLSKKSSSKLGVRSQSPKLKASTSTSSLTGGRVSPCYKKILSHNAIERKYNSDEDSKTQQRPLMTTNLNYPNATIDTAGALIKSKKDDNIQKLAKDSNKDTTIAIASSSKQISVDKHFAQIEPDFLLELDLQNLEKELIIEEDLSVTKFTKPSSFNLMAMPLTLSEKELSDSISEDSPPTSPSSSVKAFTLLNLKKKRWITRRERLSTNCLVKRASSGTSSMHLVKSGSTARFKEELGKLFKRISFSGEGDSDSNTANAHPMTIKSKPKSPTKFKGPYRQPRKLFFRKRRKSRSVRIAESHIHGPHHPHSPQAHAPLVRSTSESHSLSLRQTSSESIPSIGSEPPVFHLDDDEDFSNDESCLSLMEIPTYLKEKHEKSPKKSENQQVAVDPSKLCELIGDLGYDTKKPLKLYISSMDALLVYDPPNDVVNSSCVCLNVDNSEFAGAQSPLSISALDFDSSSSFDIKEKVDTLLNLNRNESSEASLALDLESRRPIPKKRPRNDTLVECNSSTSSSASSSGTTTSSSCKAFRKLTKLVLRRTDDEEEDDNLNNFDRFEKYVKSVHDGVTIGTGCRSPIPEEFCETSCTTPTHNHTQSLNQMSMSPPNPNPITNSNNNANNENGTSNMESNGTNGLSYNNNNDETNQSLQQHNYTQSMNGSPEKAAKLNPSNPKTFQGQGHEQIHRRSSESDLSGSGTVFMKNQQISKPLGINFEQLRMQEFPFLTISQFPEGFIYYLGGTVTARSVKLLDRIGNFEEPDPESRDAWWNELRIEMRSHCRAFGCTVILGYEEQTTMCDEVCIMSASGTAAIIVLGNVDALEGEGVVGVNVKEHRRNDSFTGTPQTINTNVRDSAENNPKPSPKTTRGRHDSDRVNMICSMLHIPSSAASLPTIVKKTRCACCKRGKVPDILLSTIEIPSGLHITGKSSLVQTQVFRSKKESKGEASAKEMSDSLPFLEYELHRRLINKLKVKGMNAIFGLQVQITQGEKLMVGIATGTATFLTALPMPSAPIICAGNLKTDAQKVLQFQKVIQETFERNREIFLVKNIVIPQLPPITASNGGNNGAHLTSENSFSDGESEDQIEDELLNQNKDTFILEVDDAEDIDIITMLIDPTPPMGYNMSNIETLVGFDDYRVVTQQMFNHIFRIKIPSLSLRQLTTYFDRLIRAITFKLRRMQPCVLSKLSFKCNLPEADEMQLCIIGMAVGLDKKLPQASIQQLTSSINKAIAQEESEMLFPFDEDKSNPPNSIANDLSPVEVFPEQVTITSSRNPQNNQKMTTTSSSVIASVSSKVPISCSPGGSSGISLNVSQSHSLNPNVSTSQTNTLICSSTTSTTTAINTFGRSARSDSTSSTTSTPESQSDGGNLWARPSVFRHSNRATRFMSLYKPISLPVSKMRHWVEITPLSSIPGAKIERYLGNLNFFFIRETTSLRECGGLSGFVHNFFTEVLAILRAHVSALGGNALQSYFMTQCALFHNPHKNQSQCVVNVGGDAIYVTYPTGARPEDGISNF